MIEKKISSSIAFIVKMFVRRVTILKKTEVEFF
jgi:hypothetical protein